MNDGFAVISDGLKSQKTNDKSQTIQSTELENMNT